MTTRAVLQVFGVLVMVALTPAEVTSGYLEAALEAARRLDATVTGESRKMWPANPEKGAVGPDLYSGAAGVVSSGIPARRRPGFWNNVGKCCGSAGVGEFFISLYLLTNDPAYLDYAQSVAADVLKPEGKR